MQEKNIQATKSDEPEWLRKRLDSIVLLLIASSPGVEASTTRVIERLLQLGYTQAEAARAIGKKTELRRRRCLWHEEVGGRARKEQEGVGQELGADDAKDT